MWKLTFIILLFCFGTAKSQNLTVEGSAPDLYVNHIVAPKENFYSVGRLYNQAPKAIASFNNIVMEKGLTIGQRIKIPLNAQNFDVSGIAAAGETLIPVTHIIVKSETLTKIGADYKVSPQMVKQWNSLNSDILTPGSPLIVGNLKIKSDQAAGVSKQIASANNELPVAKRESNIKQVNTLPEQREQKKTLPEATENKEAPLTSKGINVKTDTAFSLPTETAQPKGNPVSPSAERVVVNEITGTENKGSKEPVAKKVVTEVPKTNTTFPVETKDERNNDRRIDLSTAGTGSLAEGAFAGLFNKEVNQKSLTTKRGEAATFKSTSGWMDKKFYVLMDNVTPGTILKIESVDNKVVFAKVLGSMPEMKENTGLLIRISNSAASYLGIIDPKFPVEVSYYK